MKKLILLFFLLTCLAGFCPAQNIQTYTGFTYAPPAVDDGEILVDFRNDEEPSVILRFLQSLGLSNSQFSFFSGQEKWVRMRNVSGSLLEKLKHSSDVEGIEPNYYMSAFSVPNDPYYKYQWHLDLIGMRQAWDYPTGAPVIVAVIDTGIAYEKFQDNFLVEDLSGSQFVKPYNFVKGNVHANDDHGHGTHVAGTIAQLTNNGLGVAGVAPNVRLMPLKVLNSYGYGTMADIAAAIRYAADNGASVINMSLGGPFPSFILHKAIRYAHSKGVVIVCAAGNSGRSGISYPAHYSECISVSAVRFDRKLAWYSSYGKGLTIAAPGGDMNVDQNGDGLMDGVLQNTLNPQDRSKQGYFLFQGTSMATPHVAAAAALLVSHGITDPERVREYLQQTAAHVEGEEASSDRYGAGVLDVHAALKKAVFARNSKLLLLAVIAFLMFVALLNRKADPTAKLSFNGLSLLGLIASTTGFFFLYKFSFIRGHFWITHPVADLQLSVLGASHFASPLFFSALPAVVVLTLLYPWKRMVQFTAAFAVGSAAFLFFQILSPVANIHWIPGSLLETIWLGANGLLCLALGCVAAFRLR